MTRPNFLRRRFSIAVHLAIFGLAIVIPIALAGLIASIGLAEAERARLEDHAQQIARSLARNLDREFEFLVASLQALATSPAVAAGDFATLHAQAQKILPGRSPVITVRAADGKLAFNTEAPWGAPLPIGNDPAIRDAADRAMASGAPTITNLFTGVMTKTQFVMVVVPITVNGRTDHTINVAAQPNAITAALKLADMPPDWIVSVTDGASKVVARSRQPERYVGSTASAAFQANAAAGKTMWSGVTLDRADVLTLSERTVHAPWRVSVSVTRASLEAPLRKALGGVAALTGLGLAGSLAFAFAYGRRLSRPIQAVASAAATLTSEAPAWPATSSIAEVQEISAALMTTADELKMRAAQRDLALRSAEDGERRLRATYENASVGIGEIDRDGRFIAVNDALCRITGREREDMIGRRFQELSDEDDLRDDLLNFAQQRDRARPAYVVEKRFRRLDGELRWGRVFSAAVCSDGAFAYAVRVVLDVTEERRASEHQALLIAELNHRVKNTLAVVQSLVHQTLNSTSSPKQFRDALTGRIMALARSHELLSESEWRGSTLEAVLRTSLQANDGPDFTRTALSGPRIRVGPRSVVSLSLTLHELATNATKYGGLSRPTGALAVCWSEIDAGKAIQLDWRETGARDPGAETGTGFGSRLVRLCIENEMGGRYETAFSDGGYHLTATIPLAAIAR